MNNDIKSFLRCSISSSLLFLLVCSSSFAQQLSDDYNKLMITAQELFQQRNFDGAIEIYDAVIKMNADYLPAYTQRGLAKSFKGNSAGAIEDYSIALEKDDRYISALWNRGNEYRLTGKYKESVSDFDRALSIDSISSQASSLYENRGWAKYDAGQYEDAIIDFTNAIHRNTKSAHSYYMRGKAKQQLNKIDEACEDWMLAKAYGFQLGQQDIDTFCNKNNK